jgi:hypothetical protein
MFSLWYGKAELGKLVKVTYSDFTWYGLLEVAPSASQDGEGRRALQYVDFCERWNQREGNGESPSTTEFDAYSDVTNSMNWSVVDAQGHRATIDRAPIFFPGREVTWGLQK